VGEPHGRGYSLDVEEDGSLREVVVNAVEGRVSGTSSSRKGRMTWNRARTRDRAASVRPLKETGEDSGSVDAQGMTDHDTARDSPSSTSKGDK
jgi:hypothetical protein